VSSYSERLTVPWWSWPIGFAVASFLAAELSLGFLPLRHPLTFVVACLVAAAGLLAVGRLRVSVGGGELRVDDAHLPVEFIGQIEVIDLAGRRALMGVDAEPLAFVIQRPWISGGVRIDLDDPADPTPYWYVSSRHPRRLAEALLAARNAAVLSRT
jgi:hypothetical protein